MIRFAILAVLVLFAAGFVFLLFRRRVRLAPPSRLPEAALYLTVESAAAAKLTVVNCGGGPLVVALRIEVEVLREDEVLRSACWNGGERDVVREVEIALDLAAIVGTLEPGEYRLRFRGWWRPGGPVSLGTHAVAVA